jgi:hypothetical protein
MLFCHVWADDLEELHALTAAVGMRREWFQAPPAASWPHYDCGPKFRAALINAGAIETDARAPVLFRRAWKTGAAIA